MASDLVVDLTEIRKRLKPWITSFKNLSEPEQLQAAAARRVITFDEFAATKAFQAARRLSKEKKAAFLALAWPEATDDPAEVAAKRTRSDVAARKAKGKKQARDVVTTTLRSLLRAGCQYCLPIEKALFDHNKMAFEAHELANNHVLRMLQEGKDIEVLDQSFFTRCCNAVCIEDDDEPHIQRYVYPELYKSAKEWQALRPQDYVPLAAEGMRVFGQTLGQQMATEAGNMVMMTFYKRLKRYVKARLGLDGAATYRYLKILLEDLVPAELAARASHAWAALSLPEANMAHELCGRFTMAPTDKNLSAHPEAFMKLLRTFQLTSAAVSHKGKQFSLLPHTAGFTAKFFKINANTLRQLVLNGLTEEQKDKIKTTKTERLLFFQPALPVEKKNRPRLCARRRLQMRAIRATPHPRSGTRTRTTPMGWSPVSWTSRPTSGGGGTSSSASRTWRRCGAVSAMRS
jgi:hypothetical protein